MEENDNDWNDRILCPDESCTGTIDSNGRCRVCGRYVDGLDHFPKHSDDRIVSDQEPELSDPEETPVHPNPESNAQEDWAERRLCPDDGCIGTIGEDGRCRICGLSATDSH